MAHPEFSAVMAMGYARKLRQKTGGKTTGHIVQIGVEGYQKHFDGAQVFADTLLRTGVLDNGGGINYWGIINGGDIRNYGQLYDAGNGGGGQLGLFCERQEERDISGLETGKQRESDLGDGKTPDGD